MPYVIETIDAIAREKGRDVLYVRFPELCSFESHIEPDVLPIRKQIIQWLKEVGFVWYPCGEFVDEDTMIDYMGSIYIDVPFDDKNPAYIQLCGYLENPNGTMRFEGVDFHFLSLTIAMKNAHQDEPGFWRKWAAEFWAE